MLDFEPKSYTLLSHHAFYSNRVYFQYTLPSLQKEVPDPRILAVCFLHKTLPLIPILALHFLYLFPSHSLHYLGQRTRYIWFILHSKNWNMVTFVINIRGNGLWGNWKFLSNSPLSPHLGVGMVRDGSQVSSGSGIKDCGGRTVRESCLI